MATVVNKNTFQVLYNVNTPDYLDGNWLINPDLSVVLGYPTMFWEIAQDPVTGEDIIILMTPEEQDTHEPNVDIVMGQKIQELQAAYLVTVEGGFISTAYDGSQRMYASGAEDQLNLVGSVTMTTPFDPSAPELSVPYNSTDVLTGVKEYLMHTYSMLRQVLADGAQFKLQQLQKMGMLIYQVQGCTRISDIEKITWS